MEYLDKTLNGLIIGLVIALVFVLASCSKDNLSGTSVGFIENGVCNARDVEKITDWAYYLGADTILFHTAGLEEMALNGNTGILHSELCQLGTTDKKIPSGLGDDPMGVGYAHNLVLGNHIVAMYHPDNVPDHFITYNWKDGSWIRWKLGERPTVIDESK